MQHRPAADRRRDDLEVRDRDDPERHPQRLGRLGPEPPHHRQHPVRVGGVEEQTAAHDAAHLHQPDLDRGHHPDGGTPAAQGREQLVARPDPAQDPVRGDDLDRAEPVGRPAELAPEQPEPAPERVADDADPRERPGHRREPVLGRRRDEVRRARAGLDARGPRRRVDAHTAHPAGGDDDPAGEPGGVPVAGGLHGDREVVCGGVTHGGDDVVGVEGPHDDVGSVRVRGLEAGELAGQVLVTATQDGAADVGQEVGLGARHDLIVEAPSPEVQDTVVTTARTDASEPGLHVAGFAMFGGVSVIRRPLSDPRRPVP